MMNTYVSLVKQVRKERVWADERLLPAWNASTAKPGALRHRWSRPLLILVIAGALIWTPIGVDPVSAHTLPPCFGWSSAPLASLRPPALRRHRVIPELAQMRWYCRLQPTDPVNHSLAVTTQPTV